MASRRTSLGTSIDQHLLAKSLHYWCKGQPPVFDNYDSVWRFLRVGKKLQKYNPASPAVDYAFEILNTVAKSEFTRWSIVYDI